MSSLEIRVWQRGAVYRAYGKCQQPEQSPRFHSLPHTPIMTDVRREGPSAYSRYEGAAELPRSLLWLGGLTAPEPHCSLFRANILIQTK